MLSRDMRKHEVVGIEFSEVVGVVLTGITGIDTPWGTASLYYDGPNPKLSFTPSAALKGGYTIHALHPCWRLLIEREGVRAVYGSTTEMTVALTFPSDVARARATGADGSEATGGPR